MEEKKRSVSIQGVYYGLLTGVVLIVYSLLLFILNQHLNKTLGYVGYLFLIGGMVWGTLEYRKTYMNGFMSYGKAFTACFMIGLFAGILASLYMFVFAQFIHPGFVQELLDQTREQIVNRNANLTEEQIEQAVSTSAKFMSPPLMAIWGFIAYTLISAVISLILAIFLKKEDPSLKTSM